MLTLLSSLPAHYTGAEVRYELRRVISVFSHLSAQSGVAVVREMGERRGLLKIEFVPMPNFSLIAGQTSLIGNWKWRVRIVTVTVTCWCNMTLATSFIFP